MSSPKNPKTELEKMRSFEWYYSEVPDLIETRTKAMNLCREFNQTSEDTKGYARRKEIYSELFSKYEDLAIVPPFYCDYGKYIRFGKKVFMNFNCVILDGADVVMGDNVYIGPNCQILTVLHPLEHEERNKDLQIHKEVRIGNNVWFGAGVIIMPGVTIGDGCTIGAGSVVTRSIPDNCLAVGNPCRVLKKIKQKEEAKL